MSPKRIVWNVDSEIPSLSFSGCLPLLEENQKIPVCELCHQSMTFFFRIDTSEIEDKYLSFFQCTRCITRESSVPNFPLKKVDSHYARELQTNYRILLHNKNDSLVISEDTYATLRKKAIKLKWGKDNTRWSRIGGKNPLDKYPISQEEQYEFIMQVSERDSIRFEKEDGYPYQAEYDWFGEGIEVLEEDYYLLFGGVKLLIFSASNTKEDAFAIASRI